jgi:pimeloyl-ACP methyl ester carboxylesterase
MLAADLVWPLHGAPTGAFTLEHAAALPEQAVITAVDRPVLLGYAPETPNGRAMLILGGGGYTALMAGREGVQVARWLTALGYHAFVLIHRFPHKGTGPSAPLDDALAAMAMIRASGLGEAGVGVVGLSSGGHLAACLIADYPAAWGHAQPRCPDVLVVGYAPISTNAKGGRSSRTNRRCHRWKSRPFMMRSSPTPSSCPPRRQLSSPMPAMTRSCRWPMPTACTMR